MEMFGTSSQTSQVSPNITRRWNTLAYTKFHDEGGGGLLLETKFNKPFGNTYSIGYQKSAVYSDQVHNGPTLLERPPYPSFVYMVVDIIFESETTKMMFSSA